MAMVIQGTAEADGASGSEYNYPGPDTFNTSESICSDDYRIRTKNEVIEMAIHEDSGLTQSQCLLAVSLAFMWKVESKTSTNTIEFTTAILHLVMLQHVKLEERWMPAPEVVSNEFFDEFIKVLSK